MLSNKNELTTNIFLAILTLVSLGICGLAITGASGFPTSQLVALALAALVSAFVARFQFRFRGSPDVLPIGVMFALWGMFWYGLSAGVLLGAAAVVANFFVTKRYDREGLAWLSGRVLSMASSIGVVWLALGQSVAATERTMGVDANGVKALVLQIFIASFVHILVDTALFLVYHAFEGDSQTPQATRTRLLYRSVSTFVSAAAASTLCLPFLYFGLGFGVVFAPAVIFANLAYTIHLRRLDQKTREITEASRIHVATVEALATAIDARDQIGLGHVRRTQIYAIGIGKLLGCGEDEINALRTGALLHDIGKLAIPDHILSKPGKLTPAELEKAKIHAAVGASILENVDFKYPVVSAVKHHHERWDGEGYPDGLAGENIPLTARILAVADSYDTLRGARPYRPAHPRERARQIIAEGGGTYFDPNVVRYFLKNLARLEAEVDAQGLSYEMDKHQPAYGIGDGNYVDQIKLANREVFTLYELAREFSSSFELHETMALFTRKVGEFVPFVTCAVYLLDEKKGFATAVHVDGENKSSLTSRRIKVGQGATGIALKKRETVNNADPDLDFAFSHVELAQQYSTMASVPLIADDVLIGAVSIYARDIPGYGEEHLRLFETIARIAAEAIGKSMQHNEVKAHALTDPMTGLPNSRCLQIQFEKEVGRASRSGSCFQLLMLDLDGFKMVNDSFGHKVGDDILREVGKVIRGQLRDYDFLARYGGDEFVALIPDTSRADVMDLCSRIEKAVGEFKLEIDGGKFASVGVSPGAAGYPDQGETFNQMIVSADKAMYERKTRRKMINPPTPARQPIAQSVAAASSATAAQQALAPATEPSVEHDSFIVELDESHVVISSSIN